MQQRADDRGQSRATNGGGAGRPVRPRGLQFQGEVRGIGVHLIRPAVTFSPERRRRTSGPVPTLSPNYEVRIKKKGKLFTVE